MPSSLESRLRRIESEHPPADRAAVYVAHGPDETAAEAEARHLREHPSDSGRLVYTINTGVTRSPAFGAAA